MNKLFVLVLLFVSFAVQSQTSNDAERQRNSNERSVLEAGFSSEDTACYKKFLVNRCLDDVKARRGEALADLRRQEILLNDQERKAKGAEQIKKTEDKDSPEKQQQAADKRTDALKDSDDRVAKDQQKATDRATATANEKSKLKEAATRTKNAQDKQTSRAAKQATTPDEVKKYQQRLKKAQDRQARLAKEKASQTKPSAAPLPVSN